MKTIFKSLVVSALMLTSALVMADTGTNWTSQILAPLARTTTPINSIDQVNANYKGAHIFINITNYVSGTYTVNIQEKDPVSGTYVTILSSAALGANGITVLKVYPGITAATNLSVSDILPRQWRVNLIGATTPSMTISVGALLEY